MHAELERSKLVDQLIEVAAKHVRSFGAAEVSLALDGLARLRCQPPTVLLDALAQQVNYQQPPLHAWEARSVSTSKHIYVIAAGPGLSCTAGYCSCACWAIQGNTSIKSRQHSDWGES